MKRNSFRHILIFILTLFLGIITTGCTSKVSIPENETMIINSIDTDMTENLNTMKNIMTIAKNGKTEYTIWYEEALSSNESVMQQINRIRTNIEKKTDAVISCNSDCTYDEKLDSDKPAILIGKTAFPETKKLDDLGLKVDDYYVGTEGNKIIICGISDKAAKDALVYFNKVLTSQETDEKTLSFSSEHEKLSTESYAIKSISCAGNELNQYQIVYPQNATVHEKLFAKLLQYYLHSNYGYDLDIVKDSEEAAEYEILIGNTNRTTLQPESTYFAVLVQNNNLQLNATNMQSYEALYDYITKELLPSGEEQCHIIPDSFTYNASHTLSLEAGTFLSTESFGNVRCMFYNVYGWTAQCGPVAERQKLQIELIKTYMPDVLACMEYSTYYHSAFTYMLRQNGYTEVEIEETTANYTPLFYNKKRVKVIDSGYQLYTGANDVNSKSATWAVLELLENGKQFIAISTHLMYNQPGIDANAARVSNAKELISLIAELQNIPEYKDLPLIVGGDLNCNTASEPITVLKESGLRLAWDIAEKKNDIRGIHDYVTYDKDYETYSAWSIRPGGYAGSIDHAFVSDNVTVKSFFTLTDMYALISSDHMPELVEINLNGQERN